MKMQFSEYQRYLSPLQQQRIKYSPDIPWILQTPRIQMKSEMISCDNKILEQFPFLNQNPLQLKTFEVSEQMEEEEMINEEKSKPLKVGVMFGGGPAPGGHNVVSVKGIYDSIKNRNPKSQLYGFLNGPDGLFNAKFIEIGGQYLSQFRNLGGFDIIGTSRQKFQNKQQYQKAIQVCEYLDLDGLVIIGGDDSNTTATVLAEYFLEKKSKTIVIGIPKTIDGDLQTENLEISFGFDTACKTYSEEIGNIMMDCLSSKKNYHLIKLMGRSASHVVLECALQTRPTMAIIGEECLQKEIDLQDLIQKLGDQICQRSNNGKNYGVILFPEGLIDFLPNMKQLIREINEIIANTIFSEDNLMQHVLNNLTMESLNLFNFFPYETRNQLLENRDPHGNVQMQKIDTENLIKILLSKELISRKMQGDCQGFIDIQTHSLGYEGRCAIPSNFDANYSYSLGWMVKDLIKCKLTGYMCAIKYLKRSVYDWQPVAIPLLHLLNFEKRSGIINIYLNIFYQFLLLYENKMILIHIFIHYLKNNLCFKKQYIKLNFFFRKYQILIIYIYIYINRVNDHISKSGCIVFNFRRLLHYYLLVL